MIYIMISILPILALVLPTTGRFTDHKTPTTNSLYSSDYHVEPFPYPSGQDPKHAQYSTHVKHANTGALLIRRGQPRNPHKLSGKTPSTSTGLPTADLKTIPQQQTQHLPLRNVMSIVGRAAVGTSPSQGSTPGQRARSSSASRQGSRNLDQLPPTKPLSPSSQNRLDLNNPASETALQHSVELSKQNSRSLSPSRRVSGNLLQANSVASTSAPSNGPAASNSPVLNASRQPSGALLGHQERSTPRNTPQSSSYLGRLDKPSAKAGLVCVGLASCLTAASGAGVLATTPDYGGKAFGVSAVAAGAGGLIGSVGGLMSLHKTQIESQRRRERLMGLDSNLQRIAVEMQSRNQALVEHENSLRRLEEGVA